MRSKIIVTWFQENFIGKITINDIKHENNWVRIKKTQCIKYRYFTWFPVCFHKSEADLGLLHLWCCSSPRSTSANFPHQEIKWNYGIFCSAHSLLLPSLIIKAEVVLMTTSIESAVIKYQIKSVSVSANNIKLSL